MSSNSAPGGQQGRAYQRDQIEALLRQAVRELMADGTSFNELSVDRLRSHVGIARSTFYVYFEDKPTMLRALSATTLRRLYEAQRGWISRGSDVTIGDIEDGMRELLTLYLEDEVVMRAVTEVSAYDPTTRASYIDGVEDYVRTLERFIRRGQGQGWVVAGLHPGTTAAALAWMTERTVTQVAPGSSRRRIDSAAGSLANVVWSTLFARAR